MTDITELAQNHELRNKVNHRLYGALEFQGTSGEHATITLSIDECKSIIAAMDERLALVEALELKEEQRANWFQMAQKLGEDLDAAEKRIAELESKLSNPVQLPKTNGYWTETEKAYEEAITLAKRQIRLAGFTVEDM